MCPVFVSTSTEFCFFKFFSSKQKLILYIGNPFKQKRLFVVDFSFSCVYKSSSFTLFLFLSGFRKLWSWSWRLLGSWTSTGLLADELQRCKAAQVIETIGDQVSAVLSFIAMAMIFPVVRLSRPPVSGNHTCSYGF